MDIKLVVVLATSLAALTEIDAHGGLVIPPCRNNRGNVNIFNFTKATGEKWLSGGSCAGDMCLWFNDGCVLGCLLFATSAAAEAHHVVSICACAARQLLHRLPELYLRCGNAAWYERRGPRPVHQAELRKADAHGAHAARGAPHMEHWQPVSVWRLDEVPPL
eukprot:SAG31_NODE_1477_length_8194_cov_21.653490_6_plen_162_part_00